MSSSTTRQLWRITGGADKGGVIVRKAQETTSEQCEQRLVTGALVEEIALVGDRLHYRTFEGEGPPEGWISVKLKDKELAVRERVEAAVPAAAPASAPSAAEKVGAAMSSAKPAIVDPVGSAGAGQQPGPLLESIESLLKKHFGDAARAEPPSAYQGGQLPVMPRTVGLPTFAAVPERMKSTFKDRPARKPMIRLYGFTGVADNYFLWLGLATAVPEWCEVAVYEPRAHGFRESEPWDASLEERADDAFQVMLPALLTHAKGGISEGAPFGFISHGIGSGLMVLVAERVRRLLALEPRVVFVNDGPPPDLRMLSDKGYELLRKDPVQFYKVFQPATFAQYQQFQGSKKGEEFLERWWRGLRLFEDHSRSLVGAEPYHKFSCDVHVLLAKTTLDENLKEDKSSAMAALTGSAPHNVTGWDEEGFATWKRWVVDEADLYIHHVETDHMSIKNNPLMLRILFRELAGFCGMSEECEAELKRLKWIDSKGRDVPLQ
mmetsp:Transcript_22923/g.53647  ORF Transcript_22923/g.53647 Transcript_22923/m.53647 type:complete len:492 (-) Transcript_22923:276-1751(-)